MEKRMEKTDYKITEFHNSEFGSIRMIEDGGRLLFSGIDVAFALGYAKPRNAINVHCKGTRKHRQPPQGHGAWHRHGAPGVHADSRLHCYRKRQAGS